MQVEIRCGVSLVEIGARGTLGYNGGGVPPIEIAVTQVGQGFYHDGSPLRVSFSHRNHGGQGGGGGSIAMA
jgi:hypothetical protein